MPTREELYKENQELKERLAYTESVLNLLLETTASQRDSIKQLTATVEKLTQTIDELKEKLGKNSQNSSKPPSSDGFKKPKSKSLRKRSGKKPGGQEGHEGANLAVTEEPDRTEHCLPSRCLTCPHRDQCAAEQKVIETRYKKDIVIKTETTAYERILIDDCPCSDDVLIGDFPEDIKAPVQYGKNIQALAVSLSTIGAVSLNRVHEILSGVFGIPISPGTIGTMVSRVSAAAAIPLVFIKQALIDSALVHFDETGTRVDGKLWWVHTSCNELFTYLTINRKRGAEGTIANGVFPRMKGIAAHDCWKPYWRIRDDIMHAICNAHILRELNGLIDNHPQQTWASKFQKLLLRMKKVKERAIARGKDKLSYYHLHKFDQEYDELIEIAYSENPEPENPPVKKGRKKRGKVLALIDRLRDYKEAVCLFIKDFMVPFDNNEAERAIRNVKTKTKVSGCFRTEDGAEDYLNIMSIVGTAKKHGHSGFDAIMYLINDTPELIYS